MAKPSSVIGREYRERYPEKHKERFNKWYEANRSTNTYRCWVNRLRREYGMTEADYHALLEKQEGCCAICLKAPVPPKKLSVDHDHKTGQVRGLLCSHCNNAIGLLEDNQDRLLRAAQYLRKPPYQQSA